MASDDLICRICFETGDAEPLIAPCHCAGTQKFVHDACLRRWQHAYSETHVSNPYRALKTFICTTCKAAYRHTAPRAPRYLSFLYLSGFVAVLVLSCLYEFVFILAITGAVASMMKMDRAVRVDWDNFLPRVELVHLLSEGSLLRATNKVQFGVFQDVLLLVVSNSPSKGAFGLILNRPKAILGERVYMGGAESVQSIHILHKTPSIGGRELVPGLFYGGCYLSLLAYPSIQRATFYGESHWLPYELENEVSAGYWSLLGPASPSCVFPTAE